jgi:hypothetical protein
MSREKSLLAAFTLCGFLLVSAAYAQVTGGQAAPASIIAGGGLDGGYDNTTPNNLVLGISTSLKLSSDNFFIVSALDGSSDGKYGPELADIPGGNFDLYVLMEGGLGTMFGPLSVSGGRLKFKDTVDSPYSLFVNSNGIAAMTADLCYDDGFFSYDTRWIGLNHDSSPASCSPTYEKGYPDRGANLKTFAIHLGDLRFGFQDASVYPNRYFSPEYFISPVPQYFTQYVLSTDGRPWAENFDDNYIMGAFFEMKREGEYYLYAQALLDDFGLRFLSASFPDNPWQMALSAGGRLETAYGSFGFYSAMATKYTFSPSQSELPYGYTYYPDTRFDIDRQTADFQQGEISIEDNEIGYKYGENNLALQADWRDRLWGCDFFASIEFRLAGENSPANPWGDLNAEDTTHWLDDTVLEKRILASLSASRDFGSWHLFAAIVGGVAIDALELRAPDPLYASSSGGDSVWLYAPVSGKNVAVLKFKLGARYSWKVR